MSMYLFLDMDQIKSGWNNIICSMGTQVQVQIHIFLEPKITVHSRPSNLILLKTLGDHFLDHF